METRKRSWMKSVTWRVAGIGILGAITYAFTRDVAQTTAITLFFHALRFALYYCHERLWDRTDWGRIRHPLDTIQMRSDLSVYDRERIRRFLAEQGYLTRAPERERAGILRAQSSGSALAGRG
ncbi:MAG TPA: DUF2061 domain-containing protein [Acidobacteriota bacterium]|nr:DUF2061 domain-containing protein [Acidobacteriota bacterium]